MFADCVWLCTYLMFWRDIQIRLRKLSEKYRKLLGKLRATYSISLQQLVGLCATPKRIRFFWHYQLLEYEPSQSVFPSSSSLSPVCASAAPVCPCVNSWDTFVAGFHSDGPFEQVVIDVGFVQSWREAMLSPPDTQADLCHSKRRTVTEHAAAT